MLSPVPYLKIIPNDTETPTFPNAEKLNLGDVLLSQNLVTEGDLLKAFSKQQYEHASIGEILVGMEKINLDQLYHALGVLHRLEEIDFKTRPPILNWVKYTTPQAALKNGNIVWRNTDHSLTVAITNPDNMNSTRKYFLRFGKPVNFVLIKPACLHHFIEQSQSVALQKAALVTCPKQKSCRAWSKHSFSKLNGIYALLFIISALYFFPMIALKITLGLIFIALILNITFRIYCLYTMREKNALKPNNITSGKITKRPKVSVLVPLYKEGEILERLLSRLQALAYPKELLEICLIYEEKDFDTKGALGTLTLPWYVKTVEVPTGELQTKPRAMNYALDFCNGDIIGIYDAEDAPEINQIEQVIQKFETEGDDVACIQCILDFYNASTNWMSRCFTIEYAILFRVILPALDQLKLPIPLGGTSVYFRREILENLGRWDAYNVTEDADLGYRLYQMGYRCSWINAVTYEEANYRVIPWIKQRSRWLKGLFLTAVIHLRQPVKLHADIGTAAILTMVCLMIVPWVVCPLVPIILPMWLISFGVELPYYSNLPTWYINILVVTFIASELMSIYLGFKATDTEQHKHLRPWLVTTILYWPISFLASYKAIYEVFVRPDYWDKSEHGLNDHQYTDEIEALTRNAGTGAR